MHARPSTLRALALGALIALLPMAAAQAAAPAQKTQVPGYYRMLLGDFEVTALFDGAIELDTKLLRNARPTDLDRLLARMFVGNPKMQTAVNAYLVNTGGHLVLVDAGAAKLFGPSLGNILANLRAAGYDPAAVDTVLVTHLHPDHVGGINDAAGQPAFPNATVRVAQADADFWLSQQIADAAPEGARPFFAMARDAVRPYQAKGRWQPFAAEGEIVPGIRAVRANGHTPGHSAFVVESAGRKLLIWGDVVHAHAIQFAKPAVAIEFDVDPKAAVATRKALMKAMAGAKTLVAGMHLPFPGIGRVRAEGKDSYSWVPIEYSPLPATK